MDSVCVSSQLLVAVVFIAVPTNTKNCKFLLHLQLNNFVLWLKYFNLVRFNTPLNLNCLQLLGGTVPQIPFARSSILTQPLSTSATCSATVHIQSQQKFCFLLLYIMNTQQGHAILLTLFLLQYLPLDLGLHKPQPIM